MRGRDGRNRKGSEEESSDEVGQPELWQGKWVGDSRNKSVEPIGVPAKLMSWRYHAGQDCLKDRIQCPYFGGTKKGWKNPKRQEVHSATSPLAIICVMLIKQKSSHASNKRSETKGTRASGG